MVKGLNYRGFSGTFLTIIRKSTRILNMSLCGMQCLKCYLSLFTSISNFEVCSIHVVSEPRERNLMLISDCMLLVILFFILFLFHSSCKQSRKEILLHLINSHKSSLYIFFFIHVWFILVRKREGLKLTLISDFLLWVLMSFFPF